MSFAFISAFAHRFKLTVSFKRTAVEHDAADRIASSDRERSRNDTVRRSSRDLGLRRYLMRIIPRSFGWVGILSPACTAEEREAEKRYEHKSNNSFHIGSSHFVFIAF